MWLECSMQGEWSKGGWAEVVSYGALKALARNLDFKCESIGNKTIPAATWRMTGVGAE